MNSNGKIENGLPMQSEPPVRCIGMVQRHGLPPSKIVERWTASVACPVCKSTKSVCTDTRHPDGYTRRRRVCENGHRYTTRETVVIKPDGLSYEI